MIMGFMDRLILGPLSPVVLYFKEIFLISKQVFSCVLAGQRAKCQARGQCVHSLSSLTRSTLQCMMPQGWCHGLSSTASPASTWALTLLSPGAVQSLDLCPAGQLFFPQYGRSFQISTPSEGPAYILKA